MYRRTFLAASAALAVAPFKAIAGGWLEYSDADPITSALQAGKTVFVDYSASWCSTCARQERVITALRAENPAYDANLVFVRVDWDEFGRAPVTRSRRIPRRSTLIVLKGDQELGRIVAGTGMSQIKALMDTGLSAAQAS